jgi:hypothetical protein
LVSETGDAVQADEVAAVDIPRDGKVRANAQATEHVGSAAAARWPPRSPTVHRPGNPPRPWRQSLGTELAGAAFGKRHESDCFVPGREHWPAPGRRE